MEYLVEFALTVPDGTPPAEVAARRAAEARASADLASRGHLVRLWTAGGTILGLYRAGSRTQLDDLLDALPLAGWMEVTVTPLESHPNDPSRRGGGLPTPTLTPVYRLDATLGSPLDLGEVTRGRGRIVPLTGGTFTGPGLTGSLVPGASADWQIVRPDGTALGDIRYTLRTDSGDLLYVRSRSVRHGAPEVLARLARGEPVDPAEYVFRAATTIETAAPDLDWLNKGVFVTVGGRGPGTVSYETYLVG
jgi:muconolactone delta-isomerase